MKVSLKRVSREDKDLLLDWRNSPEISQWMYTNHVISDAEHDSWFNQMLESSSVVYWKILADAVPVGAVFLTQIKIEVKVCEWGIYLAENKSRGQGIAHGASFLSLRYAFDELKLSTVRCEAVRENERAIGLYESVGFKKLEVVVDAIDRGNEKISIVKLEISRTSWSDNEVRVRSVLDNRGLIINE